MTIAGTISVVRPLKAFEARAWRIDYRTSEGVRSVDIMTYDDDTKPPLENETIQILPRGTRFFEILVSGRRFERYRSPFVMG